MADISIKEFRENIKLLRSLIGPRAEMFASLNNEGAAYCLSLYASGLTGIRSEMDFRVEAETLSDLLTNAQAKWAEYAEKHEATIIRKMALAIIRITADLEECTDAALRNCGEFDPGQVARYGLTACEEANRIAGKGPFSIVTLGKANAEAA